MMSKQQFEHCNKYSEHWCSKKYHENATLQIFSLSISLIFVTMFLSTSQISQWIAFVDIISSASLFLSSPLSLCIITNDFLSLNFKWSIKSSVSLLWRYVMVIVRYGVLPYLIAHNSLCVCAQTYNTFWRLYCEIRCIFPVTMTGLLGVSFSMI